MTGPTEPARSHAGGRVLVVGLGLAAAGDDGVGPAVLDRLRADGDLGADLLVLAEPVALLHRLEGVGHLVVVDAIRSSGRPGSVHLVDLDDIRPDPGGSSSHGLGLAEVLRLAAALSARPSRCSVVGITGRRFSPGTQMSAEVAAAIGPAAARVRILLASPAPAEDAASAT